MFAKHALILLNEKRVELIIIKLSHLVDLRTLFQNNKPIVHLSICASSTSCNSQYRKRLQ